MCQGLVVGYGGEGPVERLDLNDIIQAISWLLSTVQQKGGGWGKNSIYKQYINCHK